MSQDPRLLDEIVYTNPYFREGGIIDAQGFLVYSTAARVEPPIEVDFAAAMERMRRLRAEPRTASIPVVIITAEGVDEANQAEADDPHDQHQGDEDAAVVGVPDPTYGEAVAAVIQPRPGEKLLEAAGADGAPLALRDRALLEVLYGCGARISEAVGLDVDDPDDRFRLDQVDASVRQHTRLESRRSDLDATAGLRKDCIDALDHVVGLAVDQ